MKRAILLLIFVFNSCFAQSFLDIKPFVRVWIRHIRLHFHIFMLVLRGNSGAALVVLILLACAALWSCLCQLLLVQMNVTICKCNFISAGFAKAVLPQLLLLIYV
jgi:hypothetical protein